MEAINVDHIGSLFRAPECDKISWAVLGFLGFLGFLLGPSYFWFLILEMGVAIMYRMSQNMLVRVEFYSSFDHLIQFLTPSGRA